MNKKQKIYLRVIIILVLLIFLISVVLLNNNYQLLLNDYKDLNNKHNDLITQNNLLLTINQNTQKDLEELGLLYSDLLANYESQLEINKDLENSFEKLDQEHTIVLEDYNTLMLEIGIFKKNIEESMNWFRVNSTIDDLKNVRRIKNYLKDCVICNDNYCNIKTACIYLINKNELYLEYQLDDITSETEDKLQSLESFITNKKGDCEDFSLLFTAEIRYLIDYVRSLNKTPIIEGITESNTTKNYWIIENKWYYSGGIDEKILSEEYIYPSVVCGNLFDPNTEEYNGHCAVGFFNREINNNIDLQLIENIEIIEPQNGLYIGSAENNGLFNINDQDYIYSVITEKDYYLNGYRLFKKDDLSWYSYGHYLNKIKDLEFKK